MIDKNNSHEGSADVASEEQVATGGSNRFKLWHVFYAIALLAVYLSLSFFLVVPTLIWFGICSGSSKAPDRSKRMSDAVGLLATAFIISFLFGSMLLPPGLNHYHPHRRTHCANKVRQLLLAMMNYESANLRFPEAIEKNDQGQLMHSWRVKILPFIEQQNLYDQYDFSQPWDSPNNLKLLDQMPDAFRCPCSTLENKTYYKLVVGPGSLYDGGAATFERIEDGSSNTVAIIEDSRNPVPWTKPEDITIDQAVELVVDPGLEGLPHVHKTKFKTHYQEGNVAMYDGSTRQLAMCGVPPEKVRLMFAINDGEIIYFDGTYGSSPSVTIQHGSPAISLIVFFILMLMPLKWVVHGRGVKSADGNH